MCRPTQADRRCQAAKTPVADDIAGIPSVIRDAGYAVPPFMHKPLDSVTHTLH